MHLGGKLRVVGQLELALAVRLQAVAAPDPLHRTDVDAKLPAIITAVQWVVSPGGSVWVSATTRSVFSRGSGGMREGRAL